MTHLREIRHLHAYSKQREGGWGGSGEHEVCVCVCMRACVCVSVKAPCLVPMQVQGVKHWVAFQTLQASYLVVGQVQHLQTQHTHMPTHDSGHMYIPTDCT